MVTLIRTDDLPAARRHEAWRHTVCDLLGPLDVRISPDAPLQGQIEVGRLGALRVANVRTATPHSVHRTKGLIRRDGPELYRLVLPITGSHHVAQDGRATLLSPGDFTIYDFSRPYDVGYESAVELAVFGFPRELLRHDVNALAAITATAIPASSGLLRRVAADLPGYDPATAARLSTILLDLITTALAERLGGSGSAPSAESQRTVYDYDRRGRGASGDTAPYAVEREIDDLGALVAEAGGRAMVFGGSSGGALALEAAAGALPITRLVVFEPPYVTDGPPLPSAKELEDLVESGRRDLAVELFMTKGAQIPADVVEAMKDQPFWAGSEAVAHTLAYEAAILGSGPVPVERFTRITVPTLVLVGSQSPPRMQTAAAAVVAAVPGASSRVLEGQAHGLLDPGILASGMEDFLGSD